MSSFFQHGARTEEGQLALLHLSRDQQLPVILSSIAATEDDQGYDEGVVTNTKFGSFPHSTLISVPWGSQVLASKVDTGSRGRRDPAQGEKRKATAISTDSPADSTESPAYKEAQIASSGFIHVLPPTPESWTTGLPHRTQVVYTPDYSYILHRIRARPGSRLIEAGSGSGSFTHAAARAVHNGSKSATDGGNLSDSIQSETSGKVFSFEFHLERHQKVLKEMQDHGLDDVVIAAHRDVYKDGFLLHFDTIQSPSANAIFLDLPAPWAALPHLTRSTIGGVTSPLDSMSTVFICTFSPCIEQAQKTVSELRKFGWLEIEVVEMQHKRIDVRREYTGFQYEGMRNVNSMATDVSQAVTKLREFEQRAREFHNLPGQATDTKKKQVQQQQQQQQQQDASKILYKEGRIVHRSEPELKTHTSYLVFAILPREWSEQDELKARSNLATVIESAPKGAKSHRQLKKEARQKRKQVNGQEHTNTGGQGGD